MGHRDKVKKLGRTKPHREAMLANMAMSLFTHRVIKTTDAKAKALKPLVDRIKRHYAILVWLPCSEQIQIRAIKDQYFRHK